MRRVVRSFRLLRRVSAGDPPGVIRRPAEERDRATLKPYPAAICDPGSASRASCSIFGSCRFGRSGFIRDERAGVRAACPPHRCRSGDAGTGRVDARRSLASMPTRSFGEGGFSVRPHEGREERADSRRPPGNKSALENDVRRDTEEVVCCYHTASARQASIDPPSGRAATARSGAMPGPRPTDAGPPENFAGARC